MIKQTNSQDIMATKDFIIETINYIVDNNVNSGTIDGIETGFKSIDSYTRGLKSGDLILITSYDYKSLTLLLQFIYNISVTKRIPGGFFSHNYSYKRIGVRLISFETGMATRKLLGGNLSPDDMKYIFEKGEAIFDAPLYYEQSHLLTFEKLCNEIRRVVALYGLKIIFIDSLNSLPLDSEIGSKKDRQLSILRKLKSLAAELDVVLVTTFNIEDSPKEKNLYEKTEFLRLFADIIFTIQKTEPNYKERFDKYDISIEGTELMWLGYHFEVLLNKNNPEFIEPAPGWSTAFGVP